MPGNRRGIVSGLLGLSRNIGLIAGASAMGAVFSIVVRTEDFTRATTAAIATGMLLTFLLSCAMMVVAILVAFGWLNTRKAVAGDETISERLITRGGMPQAP